MYSAFKMSFPWFLVLINMNYSCEGFYVIRHGGHLHQDGVPLETV